MPHNDREAIVMKIHTHEVNARTRLSAKTMTTRKMLQKLEDLLGEPLQPYFTV